jgi:hypothetical protein
MMRSSIVEKSALTNLLLQAGKKSLRTDPAPSPVRGICWALGSLELILPVVEGIWK